MSAWRRFAGVCAAFWLSSVLVTVSSPDQAHARTCESVNIALTDNYFPFSFLDSKGKRNGIGYVIVQAAAERAGVPVKSRIGLPWKRQLGMLRTGEIDAIVAINFNEERDRAFVFSDSFYADNIRIFVNRSAPISFEKLDDLVGYLGLISNGASFGSKFDTYAQEKLNLLRVKGTDKLVEMLALNRAEYMVLPETLARQLIQAKDMEDVIEPVGPAIMTLPVHVAFAQQSPCLDLIPHINGVIAEMTVDGRLEQLLEELWNSNKNWER